MRLVRQGMAFGEEVQVLYGAKIRYLLVRLFKRCQSPKSVIASLQWRPGARFEGWLRAGVRASICSLADTERVSVNVSLRGFPERVEATVKKHNTLPSERKRDGNLRQTCELY